MTEPTYVTAKWHTIVYGTSLPCAIPIINPYFFLAMAGAD